MGPHPGWYPDPYRRGEQRYWDGQAWTLDPLSGGRLAVGASDGSVHIWTVPKRKS